MGIFIWIYNISFPCGFARYSNDTLRHTYIGKYYYSILHFLPQWILAVMVNLSSPIYTREYKYGNLHVFVIDFTNYFTYLTHLCWRILVWKQIVPSVVNLPNISIIETKKTHDGEYSYEFMTFSSGVDFPAIVIIPSSIHIGKYCDGMGYFPLLWILVVMISIASHNDTREYKCWNWPFFMIDFTNYLLIFNTFMLENISMKNDSSF